MLDIGMPELLIVLVVILLLFGGSRLPKLAHNIGESMRELRDGFSGKDSPPETAQSKGKKNRQKT